MAGDEAAMPGIGLEVVAQLCSRLCHDLAGPVGAIRNGLELLDEGADEDGASSHSEADREALALIAHSATQASRRLRLFRYAYGRAASEGLRDFAALRETVAEWLEGGRVVLSWPNDQPDPLLATRHGLGRALVNLAILAAEAIPQGGTVTVAGGGTEASGWVTVTATGRTVKWPAEITEALAGTVGGNTLGPRAIQAAVAGRFIASDGLGLSWSLPVPATLALRLFW